MTPASDFVDGKFQTPLAEDPTVLTGAPPLGVAPSLPPGPSQEVKDNLQATVERARAAQAAVAARGPKYTMDSTLHKGANPYEAGTEAHETFTRTREGMTVREFCALFGQYPRGLNYLTPMLRHGAVETRSAPKAVRR